MQLYRTRITDSESHDVVKLTAEYGTNNKLYNGTADND